MPRKHLSPDQYREIRAAVIEAGYAHIVDWVQNIKAPETARVWATINAGKPVNGNVLGKS